MLSDFTTEVSMFCVVSGAKSGCTHKTLYTAQKYQEHIKLLGLQCGGVTLSWLALAVTHMGIFWQLLKEATPKALLLPKPGHVNLIHTEKHLRNSPINEEFAFFFHKKNYF